MQVCIDGSQWWRICGRYPTFVARDGYGHWTAGHCALCLWAAEWGRRTGYDRSWMSYCRPPLVETFLKSTRLRSLRFYQVQWRFPAIPLHMLLNFHNFIATYMCLLIICIASHLHSLVFFAFRQFTPHFFLFISCFTNFKGFNLSLHCHCKASVCALHMPSLCLSREIAICCNLVTLCKAASSLYWPAPWPQTAWPLH